MATPAHSDVWMVKPSGALGCSERETLIKLDPVHAAKLSEGRPPDGCVNLYSGERLLDQLEAGVGFSDYMKVERANGSTVYVRGSALVADPGIGSVTGDRAE